MLSDDYLYCGLSWSEDGEWAHEVTSSRGTIERWTGPNNRLAFRLVGDLRYCTGHFKFRNGLGTRQPCTQQSAIKSGKQCDRCRYLEGFANVHQHVGDISGLPPQIRDYIATPHYLYIACFGGGQVKVGTAAESRRSSRLYEQGAIAARIIARSPDGLHVRGLERLVSETGFKQQIRGKSKLTTLLGQLDSIHVIRQSLEEATRVAVAALPPETELLDDEWTGGERFYNRLLDYGRILSPSPFDGPEYVVDGLDALGHTILCQNGDESELTLIEENRFIGRRLQLDDSITGSPTAVQTSLF